ncbi:Uma2 family endonuclease [Bacillus sp. FJAT-45350]|uniref:Uma2 family endonuclease n=1 Tax=Bacillus sp. FJAT-45350 TaxID=2011014 RepID=UPI00211BFF3F|nr:Uma2 family endonuclease [Bacillus sp. FJAT-45350]
MSAMRPDQSKVFSYADYLQWKEGDRLELINGKVYMMTPAPSRKHQEIVLEIGRQLSNSLKGNRCNVYIAPFDVRFLENEDDEDDNIYTVVQPDLTIVCDKSKLDDRGLKGTPDFVIEVISPSTASTDYIQKMNLYEKSGVNEYWIVHPTDQVVLVFVLEDGTYGKPKVYDRDNCVKVEVIKDLEVDLKEVFHE